MQKELRDSQEEVSSWPKKSKILIELKTAHVIMSLSL